jgi:hypothetical protein
MSISRQLHRKFKSTKYNEVKSYLITLHDGVHNVGEIIDTILHIDNFKSKTLPKISITGVSPKYSEGVNVIKVDELWVDLTYQRKIQLAKLIDCLIKKGGFTLTPAGTIDYAERNDGVKFVWDGLGRCLMAGMVGMKEIASFSTIHEKGLTNREEQKEEADWFATRNGQNRAAKAEELFKAYVCQEKPDAMRKLETLKKCNLDIEGLNPTGKLMSGFKAFDTYHDDMSEQDWMDSSDIIRSVWTDQKTVGVWALTGIAHTVKMNEYAKVPNLKKQLKVGLIKWRETHKRNNQQDFFKYGFRRKDLIGYLLCTKVLGENPNTGPLVSTLGLKPEDKEMVEVEIKKNG